MMVALDYDGHDPQPDIRSAIANGCRVILSRRPLALDQSITQVIARDFGWVLGRLSSSIHANPSHQLKILAVTGTNGKTTTSHFFQQLMQQAGQRFGLIGSNVYDLGGQLLESWKTTPYPPDFHALLAQAQAAGLEGVALEASSAGLMMDRLLGTRVEVAAFTNLTPDHRIHHPTLEDYFAAKLRLFIDAQQDTPPRFAVINIDDPWGQKLYGLSSLVSETISFGLQASADVQALDLSPLDLANPLAGVQFELLSPWGKFMARLPLLGRFNIYNVLAAFSAAVLMGVTPSLAARGLGQLQLPRGRLQEIPNQKGFRVFVDYAHSVDSLIQVERELRAICRSRLIVLFGCSGMRGCIPEEIGQAAASDADCCIVTTQDPGLLNAGTLAQRAAAGIPSHVERHLIADRKQAIQFALDMAQAGDVVLLAGKGHEKAQIIGRQRVAHDEIAVATALLHS
jgi:UDP-N-acetylmuramoyl-L-alanyl-D-glutamate--2,6-diaminopimelate ligase